MIRYSHVSLTMLCNGPADATVITAHLGVQPSRIRESKTHCWSKEQGHAEKLSYSWVLDSPKGHMDGDPTARLYALADAIEPFGERLRTLDVRFQPWVDVVYHITPQHSHGITGEFDWLRMPADLMGRFAAWNLNVSYESFWFDHPDWVRPRRCGFFRRILDSWRNRPNQPAAGKAADTSQLAIDHH